MMVGMWMQSRAHLVEGVHLLCLKCMVHTACGFMRACQDLLMQQLSNSKCNWGKIYAISYNITKEYV